jgi:hypothetical protein
MEQQAKSKALTDYVYFNFQDDWWRNVYEDAERVFLKLTGFDIDRGAYCNGEWLIDADKCANAIIQEHGDGTSAYLLAKQYLQIAKHTPVYIGKDKTACFRTLPPRGNFALSYR